MIEIFYGVVEDRNDPQKLGRVRVRVHQLHTARKDKIATADLPWSQVILPTTTAALSGFGIQHGLVEGSTVAVIFRDDNYQDPVIIGSTAGHNLPKEIPVADTNLFGGSTTGNIDLRSVDRGFNDPRRLKYTDYDGTVDGVKSVAHSRRMDGLLASIEDSPLIPEALEINYDGKGSKYKNPDITEDDLPYYPLAGYYNQSDISVFAKGEAKYKFLNGSHIPDTKADPQYPYNKSLLTESGHLIEYDDTRDKERILEYHRTGTFREITPEGNRVTRVVNDDYEVVCGKKEVTVCGNVRVIVKGNADIEVSGKTDIVSGKDLSIIAPTINLNTAPTIG